MHSIIVGHRRRCRRCLKIVDTLCLLRAECSPDHRYPIPSIVFWLPSFLLCCCFISHTRSSSLKLMTHWHEDCLQSSIGRHENKSNCNYATSGDAQLLANSASIVPFARVTYPYDPMISKQKNGKPFWLFNGMNYSIISSYALSHSHIRPYAIKFHAQLCATLNEI